MGMGKWMARKGSIGQTAQWVAQAFWGAIGSQLIEIENLDTEEGTNQETRKVVLFALNARFNGDTEHPDYIKIIESYDEVFGPGLAGFTVAILDVEADFMKNTEANRKMFWEVIYEELEKGNVGEKLL
jgi:hypothetical protein